MLKTIQFEGTLDCLEPVGNLVVAAAKEVGLSKERSYKLQLAVDEILTNIVLHGYG